MGAWGEFAFDNDTACDWAYGLEGLDDLSLVESTFGELEQVGDEYLDSDIACNALAACEVIARIKGSPGYKNSHTEEVDRWVAANKIEPGPALLKRAFAAIDRVLADDSELCELWDASAEGAKWRKAVEDLRKRLGA